MYTPFWLSILINLFPVLLMSIPLEASCLKSLSSASPDGRLSVLDREAEGSNEGVWVKDEAGRVWFKKRDGLNPHSQASAEVISSSIYRHFGYLTPDTYKIKRRGQVFTLAREIPRVKGTTNFNNMNTPELRRLRFVAAYLKDWDRIANPGNNLVLRNGKIALIDFGGSLGFEARGNSKAGNDFSAAIGTFEDTNDIKIIYEDFIASAPDRHPWIMVTKKDALQAVKQFQTLTDEKITEIVRSAQYPDPNDEQYMIRALISRRDGMINCLVESVSQQEIARRQEPSFKMIDFSERKRALQKKGFSFVPINLMTDSDLITFMKPENLLKAAKNGFLNGFQTGSSSGEQSMSVRAQSEKNLFDIDYESPGKFRPFYALLNIRKPVKIGERVDPSWIPRDFGPVAVVFRNRVKKTTTWSYGDTYNMFFTWHGQIFEELQVEPKQLVGDFSDPMIAKAPSAFSSYEYLEAQIFPRNDGTPHTMDDVDYLMVDLLMLQDNGLINKLKSLGKPVYELTKQVVAGRTVFFPGKKL